MYFNTFFDTCYFKIAIVFCGFKFTSMQLRLPCFISFFLLFFFSISLSGQVYILGEGDSVIQTCGGMVLDPGGEGDYSDSSDVIQTYLSDRGDNGTDCLRTTVPEPIVKTMSPYYQVI